MGVKMHFFAGFDAPFMANNCQFIMRLISFVCTQSFALLALY